ncbi:putative ABC transport system ATP-binding protein [Rhizobium sp. NFR07]|uniref:ABC transporter transmembrane domain-containing protein n=1 Tax=Rhizobium sp. NFR07 TaxID=1566262 RepID=UPI0008F2F0CE|nr:ABC transporter transmembrane domain-containing protein [Rhizobium sp. NFR07]SFA92202.1 putative ABC transport system ATP-binding protein [Rhizobium sp. NFR07]
MQKTLLRYIWTHTRPQQSWILFIVALSMIPYFLAFDLPKQIINGPIQGEGFEDLNATQNFLDFSFNIPLIDQPLAFDGFPLDRMQTLVALSGVFLLLVIINGGFKYYINTYKGRLGERLLRRIRFELFDRVLRFPPRYVKSLNGAEIASMVKDEVEPFGGFTGDAFVQPALLGGQALAALVFIILQNFWLGMVAAFMVAIQVIIIPKMRRRLIELGRQRQITARRLAGKVSEVVEGLGTIHAYDTSNYERADVASRLGEIFRIRYDLYQWKFLVKFLNNFLSQLTPFLFYLIGGYLTLRGTLDVGQLVAVINAYKDLPGPLKELIDWDQARQDVQVKYEQVVENFEIEDMIPVGLHALTRENSHPKGEALQAAAVSVNDDSGAKVVDHVTMKVERGESVAMIDHIGRGAEAMAEALGRVTWPSSGRVCLGETDIRELPESVTGRYISYVSTDSYFFHGTLLDNLVYGLKHAPVNKIEYTGKDARQRLWEVREAKLAGNPHLDIRASWVDYTSAALGGGTKEDLKKSLLAALDVVQLTDDILELALHSTIDPKEDPKFAARVVEMRHALRERMQELGMDTLVVPFEPHAYNSEATVAENLLFGATLETLSAESELLSSEHFYAALRKVGLQRTFVEIGRTVAKNLVEIFGGLPADHPFFRQVTSLSAEDITYYQSLLQRRSEPKPANFRLSDPDKAFIRLTLEYVEPRYRLGILTTELQDKIVGSRELFYTELPSHLRDLVERYDPDKYVSVATLRENIVFGKLSNRNADGVAELRALASKVSQELGFSDQLVRAGLDYDIGAGGRRLTPIQRRKLNLARALLRRSDYYVFNKPLPGLERHAQEEIVQNVLAFLRQQENDPAVIWVLSNISLSRLFDRVVMFDSGAILEEGSYETLEQESGTFKALVA